jgi:hypothetical protein
MSRRTSSPKQTGPGLWESLEATQLELETYISYRLGVGSADGQADAADAFADEPAWLAEERAASWPAVLIEAEHAVC